MSASRSASSGSLSARNLSPSARARAHEKKLKDRELRRLEQQGPGPGSYDSRRSRAGDSLDADKKDGHCSSFRSKTPRGNADNDYSLRDLTLSKSGSTPIAHELHAKKSAPLASAEPCPLCAHRRTRRPGSRSV